MSSQTCIHKCLLHLTITDIDDLFDVHCELLNAAHNWKSIGKALRLHPDLLSRIEADQPDVKSRLNEILTEWLKKAYNTTRFGLPSWKLLVAAVAHPAGGNDRALAERIAGKYNGKINAIAMYRFIFSFPSNILSLCHNRRCYFSPSLIFPLSSLPASLSPFILVPHPPQPS